MPPPKKLYLADFAARAGVNPRTLTSWRGRGVPAGNPVPEPDGMDVEAGHARPWWWESTYRRWAAARPGHGGRPARTGERQPPPG